MSKFEHWVVRGKLLVKEELWEILLAHSLLDHLNAVAWIKCYVWSEGSHSAYMRKWINAWLWVKFRSQLFEVLSSLLQAVQYVLSSITSCSVLAPLCQRPHHQWPWMLFTTICLSGPRILEVRTVFQKSLQYWVAHGWHHNSHDCHNIAWKTEPRTFCECAGAVTCMSTCRLDLSIQMENGKEVKSKDCRKGAVLSLAGTGHNLSPVGALDSLCF